MQVESGIRIGWHIFRRHDRRQGMQVHRYAIALGSNRRHGRHGAPADILRAAMSALGHAGLTMVACSRLISTPALGPAGRSFANAAVLIETSLGPPNLLTLLKEIERAFGRRRGRRWGARVLDLDIVLWSGGRWPRYGGGRLIIPHRGLEGRDFVLRPLVEIAPLWRTASGRTVRQARFSLRRRAG